MAPTETTLLQALVDAYRRTRNLSLPYNDRAQEYLDWLVKYGLPSGSGFDNGCKLGDTNDYDKRIVIETSFRHMNGNGMYCGWTDHKAIITPAWGGFELRITGQNKNDIKDYIDHVFTDSLTKLVPTYTTWKETQ
jgi:hypothetical protein